MGAATADEAVTPIRSALEADGYELLVEADGPQVVMRIKAGAEACEECLVPPTVMRPMIDKLLADAGLASTDWTLVYPTDLHD